MPRFSYQLKNTRLNSHIDIDRIVGINLNLMSDHIATIHLQNVAYEYECALIDVGSIVHSVERVPFDRLVLKLAIRESWDKIYTILKEKNMIINPCNEYVSILKDNDRHMVRL
jgi:hypothetical protein